LFVITAEAVPTDQPEPRTDGRSVEELTELTASGLPWMTMSRIGSEVVLLVSTVVLARMISPADFGAFAVALIVAGLAISIPTAGVGMSLVQRDVVDREHLEAGVALALLIALAVGCVTKAMSYVVVAPLIGSTAAQLIRLCCPMFLLYAVGTVSAAILQRRLDFRRLAIMEVSGNAARVIVSVGLASAAGLGGTALVYGLLAGTAVTSAIAISAARPPRPRLRRRAVRDIAEFGLPAALAAVAWTGFINGDYAVIAARLGTAAAGQYWRAYTLAVSYQSKVSILMQSMAFPLLSRSATPEDLLQLRARIIRILTVVLFPILGGLAITAPIVVPAAYGHAWTSAVVPTQVLCIGGAATLVIDAIGSVLMATGRAKGLLGYGLGHFVVYVGSVIVVSQFGLVAVAIDGAIVHSAFAVVAYAMIARRTSQSPLGALWQDICPATVSCLGMGVVAVPVDLLVSSAHLGSASRFVAIFAACSLGYLVTLRLAFGDAWKDVLLVGRHLVPGAVQDGAQSLRRRARALRPITGRSA
jgi:PST family polysaccharide transporter